MNFVAVLVTAVSVLFLLFAAATAFQLVVRAVRASRAGHVEQEKSLVRDLVGLVGLGVCVGLAGFWAVSDPDTYDVTRHAQMSGRERRQLTFGLFWAGAGLVCLIGFALKHRRDQQGRQSDAAVARAIDDWRAEQTTGTDARTGAPGAPDTGTVK